MIGAGFEFVIGAVIAIFTIFLMLGIVLYIFPLLLFWVWQKWENGALWVKVIIALVILQIIGLVLKALGFGE